MSNDPNPISLDALVAFLVEAKLHTYAAQDEQASVPSLLPGGRQLEYRRPLAIGGLLYRDIYFGGDFFVGQETVYHLQGEQQASLERPIWAMNYAGGALPAAGEADVALQEIYAFLGSALRRVGAQRPYRGPRQWQDCAWIYQDESQGDPQRFWGREQITFQGALVYELRYAGGIIC